MAKNKRIPCSEGQIKYIRELIADLDFHAASDVLGNLPFDSESIPELTAGQASVLIKRLRSARKKQSHNPPDSGEIVLMKQALNRLKQKIRINKSGGGQECG